MHSPRYCLYDYIKIRNVTNHLMVMGSYNTSCSPLIWEIEMLLTDQTFYRYFTYIFIFQIYNALVSMGDPRLTIITCIPCSYLHFVETFNCLYSRAVSIPCSCLLVIESVHEKNTFCNLASFNYDLEMTQFYTICQMYFIQT